MQELRIEPRFRDKIPPLTDDEFKQLEANILEDGEVYEPIAVWNGVIVDGHNRWKIVQAHPEIPYKVREMDFPDEWAAFDWMYKKQLGRRNLTEQQRAYMIGKMYEARKKSIGAQEGHAGRNQHTVANVDKMSDSAIRRKQRDGTSGEIGKEIGVDGRTVRRAEKFAKGVDALRDVSPEAADKVLLGQSKISKNGIQSLAHSEPEQVRRAAQAIETGQPLYIERDDSKCVSGDSNKQEYHFGIDGLAEIVAANGESYVEALKNTLRVRLFIMEQDGAKERISRCIDEVIKSLNEVKEEYCNEVA